MCIIVFSIYWLWYLTHFLSMLHKIRNCRDFFHQTLRISDVLCFLLFLVILFAFSFSFCVPMTILFYKHKKKQCVEKIIVITTIVCLRVYETVFYAISQLKCNHMSHRKKKSVTFQTLCMELPSTHRTHLYTHTHTNTNKNGKTVTKQKHKKTKKQRKI